MLAVAISLLQSNSEYVNEGSGHMKAWRCLQIGAVMQNESDSFFFAVHTTWSALRASSTAALPLELLLTLLSPEEDLPLQVRLLTLTVKSTLFFAAAQSMRLSLHASPCTYLCKAAHSRKSLDMPAPVLGRQIKLDMSTPILRSSL